VKGIMEIAVRPRMIQKMSLVLERKGAALRGEEIVDVDPAMGISRGGEGGGMAELYLFFTKCGVQLAGTTHRNA
jgi:hypothetical protein